MNVYEVSGASAPAEYVRPPKLNVYIVDASGSMGWAMRQLKDDTIRRVRELPSGDAVLIGLFSSPGWFRWIATRELTSAGDYSHVEQIVQSEFYTRGMTCFSEIIADTPKAINPLLAKYSVVTFTFMSDGCPTVWDIRAEEAALISGAQALKQYITAGAVVAYGDYANRPLLSGLARTMGIEFLSADVPEQVGAIFSRISGGRTTKKRKVKVPPSTTTMVFSVEPDGTVASYSAEEGEVTVSETATVFATGPSTASLGASVTGEAPIYGAALAYLGMGRQDEAVALLSSLGDVALVRGIYNALTNSEFAKAEDGIRRAITDETARFVGGKQIGCVPTEDTPDLIDTLDLLRNDEDARFYPYHHDFKYKRIGRATSTAPGYPSFEPDTTVGVEFTRVVGNAKELNLSIGTVIPGTVKLPDEAASLQRTSVDLPEVWPCHIHRTYSLVSNAIPTVTQLPVSLGEKTFHTLQLWGVIAASEAYAPGQVYLLDMTAVPACNKARGKNACDWEAFGDIAIDALKLGSKIKVLKAKRDELDPNRDAEKSIAYTADQSTFLEGCGLRRDNSFGPPSVQEEPTDKLDVRTFEVKVAKSSDVSMNDFALMLAGTKKFNWVGELMREGQKEIDGSMPQVRGQAIEWLNARLKALTVEKRELDAKLNNMRYAVAVGGHWAKHHKDDKVTFKTPDDKEFSLVFGTTEKKI